MLRGRGRHFCGGTDLAWMQQSMDLDYRNSLAMPIAELMAHLYNLPQADLGGGQGAVFGGGVGLVRYRYGHRRRRRDLPACPGTHRPDPATIAPFVVRPSASAPRGLFADRRALRADARASRWACSAKAVPPPELERPGRAWICNLLQNSPRAWWLQALYHEVEGRRGEPGWSGARKTW